MLTRYVLDGNEPEGISAHPAGQFVLYADAAPLLDRAEAVVRSIEWRGTPAIGYCPSCGQYKFHESTCLIAALLRDLGGAK